MDNGTICIRKKNGIRFIGEFLIKNNLLKKLIFRLFL